VSLREKDKALRQLADEKSAIKAQLGTTSRELKEEMEKNSKLENQIKVPFLLCCTLIASIGPIHTFRALSMCCPVYRASVTAVRLGSVLHECWLMD
jgi:hypothetical protein